MRRFPIHCAVLGGGLKLFLWLVYVNFCPMKMTRTGNRNNQQVTEELIKTSKKRSVFDIAMTDIDALNREPYQHLLYCHQTMRFNN